MIYESLLNRNQKWACKWSEFGWLLNIAIIDVNPCENWITLAITLCEVLHGGQTGAQTVSRPRAAAADNCCGDTDRSQLRGLQKVSSCIVIRDNLTRGHRLHTGLYFPYINSGQEQKETSCDYALTATLMDFFSTLELDTFLQNILLRNKNIDVWKPCVQTTHSL